jgi:hypothetical protein
MDDAWGVSAFGQTQHRFATCEATTILFENDHSLLREHALNQRDDFFWGHVHDSPVLRGSVVLDPRDSSILVDQDEGVARLPGRRLPAHHVVRGGDPVALVREQRCPGGDAVVSRRVLPGLGRVGRDAEQLDVQRLKLLAL